jgi:hypothetical protein
MKPRESNGSIQSNLGNFLFSQMFLFVSILIGGRTFKAFSKEQSNLSVTMIISVVDL